MKKKIVTAFIALITIMQVAAQTDSTCTSPRKHCPHSYDVKQAFEVESLFPMFFTGGYHFAAGYRYERFRVRVSVINGGHYDAEPAGVHNSSSDFKRYYRPSPGLFLGYNLWRNLEAYTFLEAHTFNIEQKSTGLSSDIHSTDFGFGLSYQFFIGHRFYIQPGYHIYLRKDQSADIGQQQYHIPTVDLAPVLRVGYRIWSKR